MSENSHHLLLFSSDLEVFMVKGISLRERYLSLYAPCMEAYLTRVCSSCYFLFFQQNDYIYHFVQEFDDLEGVLKGEKGSILFLTYSVGCG